MLKNFYKSKFLIELLQNNSPKILILQVDIKYIGDAVYFF